MPGGRAYADGGSRGAAWNRAEVALFGSGSIIGHSEARGIGRWQCHHLVCHSLGAPALLPE